MYYINLAELFVISEKKEQFLWSMISMYNISTKYSFAKLVSSLLVILEENDMNSLYLKLNVLFSTIQTQDDREDLLVALDIVKDDGKNGNRLDKIMFFDQEEDFVNKEMEKIKSLEKEIFKLKNHE